MRAVQALPDGSIASASQDHTAKVWVAKDGASAGAAGGVYYDMKGEFTHHREFRILWVCTFILCCGLFIPGIEVHT